MSITNPMIDSLHRYPAARGYLPCGYPQPIPAISGGFVSTYFPHNTTVSPQDQVLRSPGDETQSASIPPKLLCINERQSAQVSSQ